MLGRAPRPAARGRRVPARSFGREVHGPSRHRGRRRDRGGRAPRRHRLGQGRARAAVSLAQGDHGGEEEAVRRPKTAAELGLAVAPPLVVRESMELPARTSVGTVDQGRSRRRPRRPGAPAARRSEGDLMGAILVLLERRAAELKAASLQAVSTARQSRRCDGGRRRRARLRPGCRDLCRDRRRARSRSAVRRRRCLARSLRSRGLRRDAFGGGEAGPADTILVAGHEPRPGRGRTDLRAPANRPALGRRRARRARPAERSAGSARSTRGRPTFGPPSRGPPLDGDPAPQRLSRRRLRGKGPAEVATFPAASVPRRARVDRVSKSRRRWSKDVAEASIIVSGGRGLKAPGAFLLDPRPGGRVGRRGRRVARRRRRRLDLPRAPGRPDGEGRLAEPLRRVRNLRERSSISRACRRRR